MFTLSIVSYKIYLGLRGAIIHSDRSTQYTSKEYRKSIKKYEIMQSMNSAGWNAMTMQVVKVCGLEWKMNFFMDVIILKKWQLMNLRLLFGDISLVIWITGGSVLLMVGFPLRLKGKDIMNH